MQYKFSSLVRQPLLWLSAAVAIPAGGQPPGIPPEAIDAPPLPVVAVPGSEALELPPGLELGQVASVAVDRRGHVFVLHRGDKPLLEFDADGRFVRGFGDGLFERAHGLMLTPDGGFWVTDVGSHVVMQLDPDGKVLRTLGTRGVAGVWDEPAGRHLFDEPNDVAIGRDGSIYVAQGHSRGEPMVLRFDADGHFVRAWGGRGTYPWEFAVAHSLVVDDEGRLYVADRENRRIQIYSPDGDFIRGWVYRGMACSLALTDDGRIWMTTGFDGQIVELDRNGAVLGVTGHPGDGANEYGEAHDLAVAPNGDVWIADVVNRRLTKLVPVRR